MNVVGTVAGVTVTLVAIYLFVANAEGANKVIKGLASGYADVVVALQGKRSDSYA